MDPPQKKADPLGLVRQLTGTFFYNGAEKLIASSSAEIPRVTSRTTERQSRWL
jgi:hypothetical protein